MHTESNQKTGNRSVRKLFHAAGLPAALAGAVLSLLFLFACRDAALNVDDDYLIRVGDRIVTVSDFNHAFEIAKSAYPHDLPQNSALLQEARIRVFNQMVEEQLVLQRAAELKIELTEAEAAAAIAEVKADYPEGVFEQMLLEHAVPYSLWEKRLKVRLMLEKVVEREVHQKINLTPEEIAVFYKENYKGKEPQSDQNSEKTAIDDQIVKQLRRQKAEAAYRQWIKNLREQYTVDINQSEWNRLAGR